MANLSAVLKNHLESANPDDWVDVVLEVADPPALANPPTDRPERIAAKGDHFTSSNQEIMQFIQNAGGQVLDKSWLSSAIKARIQVHDIARLLSLHNVELIDLPHRLTRG
jgi:hypothetical protein